MTPCTSSPPQGVKEDVSDIILNLKDLVLGRVRRARHGARRKRGPADVSGHDLHITADVEVLNPDIQLATVNAKGRLAIDVTVERGKGYVSAERNKRSAAIGVIPIDSVFSPIRQVTIEVEAARVEHSAAFDRLILDIRTDGSIAPRDALASAGQTLKALVSLVGELADDGTDSSSATSVRRPGSPDLDSRSRTSISPSGRATASSVRRSTRSAS